MYRWWLLLFIFSISLYAISDKEVLNRADGLMNSKMKSNHFRAYNDYKNIYLRSIMLEDDNLKIRALKGIVKSGKKLHIDIGKYSNELLNTRSTTSSYKAPKSISKVNKDKNIKVRSSHRLKSIGWENDKLVLEFDKRLKSKQINYFTLYDSKKNRHKYVFDIHASMLTKSKNLRKAGINRIKLGQFDSKTLRLVIENTKKIKIKFYKRKNKLVIDILTGKSKTKKSDIAAFNKYIPTKVKAEKAKVIVIDPGHGGKDPGAVGYRNYREKIVVMNVAKELKTILKSRGYKVYMTRDRDKFIKLSKRTSHANDKHADLFISIHANAVSKKRANKAHGIECYFLSTSRSKRASEVAEQENSADMSDMNRYGKQSFLNFLNTHKIVASNKLAIDLQRGMLSTINKSYKNVKDGGVREGPFWVLIGAQMPAVLVEVGFISHPREARRLVTSKYQKRLALGMANGIDRYFINN